MGTFIHEFGHALGFPDFYNTNSQGIETPYFWSIMDRGNYLGYGKTPIGFSAYERAAMDWLTYTDLKDEAAHVNLRPLAEYNYALKIETGRLGDYYILENRPATGFDKAIYGEGMLIWHIDASNYSELINSPNNTSSHLRIDLVRTDNNKS
ncbi:MAG: immune inhibitor A, partial [Paramuribaculum sp.]|nr:immune inhibitor A [Paramuribaculum sp.]